MSASLLRRAERTGERGAVAAPAGSNDAEAEGDVSALAKEEELDDERAEIMVRGVGRPAPRRHSRKN